MTTAPSRPPANNQQDTRSEVSTSTSRQHILETLEAIYPATELEIVAGLEERFQESIPKLNSIPYIHDLVPNDANFAVTIGKTTPNEKSKCLLITGLSGSGKSWFAAHGLPLLWFSDKCSFVFLTLDRKTAMKMQDTSIDEEWRSSAISYLFDYIKKNMAKENGFGYAHEQVSEASMEMNSGAKEVFLELFQQQYAGDAAMTAWSQGRGLKLERSERSLVIIVDEYGSSLPFTRELVDISRNVISSHLGRLAQHVKIVLVGTRLDSLRCKYNMNKQQHHGTDPLV